MAPFTHAVRFVDGDARELALGVHGAYRAAECLGLAIFRGNVEQSGAGVTGKQISDDLAAGCERCCRVYGLHRDAMRLEGVDLVFHQGQQWGDDKRDFRKSTS